MPPHCCSQQQAHGRSPRRAAAQWSRGPLRGISAVDGKVAWASGRDDTVLRTLDGGRHWQAIPVPQAGELDFRDIEGFDAKTAVILAIGPGEASRAYRTCDAGKTWQLALQNHDRARSSIAWRSMASAVG